MYTLSEVYGTRDFLSSVENEHVQHCKNECVFHQTIPCDPYEAMNLYMHLREVTVAAVMAEIQAISPVHTDGKCQRASEQSWLAGCIPDANVDLRGFTSVKGNRDTKACGKSKGGGLILDVNDRWCNPSHVTVKDTVLPRFGTASC